MGANSKFEHWSLKFVAKRFVKAKLQSEPALPNSFRPDVFRRRLDDFFYGSLPRSMSLFCPVTEKVVSLE